MNQTQPTKAYKPKQFTRRLAEQISALEGLYLSDEMKSKFAQFDSQKLDGDERRARLLAHFKAS